MKFFIIILLFAIIALVKSSDAQDVLYVMDSVLIDTGLSIYVKGGIRFEGNAVLQNNGSIFLQTDTASGGENWTNNVSPNLFSGTGKVIFMSSEQQTIGGTDTSVFYDLEINNSSTGGIILENSSIVQDTLFLYDGILYTDTNRVIIENPDSSSISGYQLGSATPSFINGNLRRFVNSSNNSYDFPVGKNSVYYLHRIRINSVTGNINYFDSYFDILDHHLDAELNVIEDGKPYYSVCNEGVWYLIPDQQPNSILYNYWAYIGNFTSCDLYDNYFAVLKRLDSSLTAADWDCNNCGVGNGLNPDNGDGRVIADGYALRKNLNSFSQYGIGKMLCILDVNLGSDTTLCHEETLILSADSGFTYLWNTGSSDQEIVADTTGVYSVAVSDSINCFGNDTISVVILPQNITNHNYSICQGDSIFLNGLWQNSTGIYYDTLYTSLGCDSVIIADVTVNNTPIISLGNDTVLCYGETVLLSVDSGFTYLWNTGSSNQSVIADITGDYYVAATDLFGCTGNDTISVVILPENLTNNYFSICEGDSILLNGYWQSISGTFYDSLYSVFGCDSVIITELTVNESPEINLDNDTTIITGNSCVLEADGGILYVWSNGENTPDITVNPEQTTIYTVTVTNIYDCYSTDSVTVFVSDLAEIFIPNAITPNGDGKNDCFFIRGLEDYPENHLIIYNRWGNIVFESSSYSNDWNGVSQINGEPLPNGTYFYILKLNDNKNTNYTGYIELIK